METIPVLLRMALALGLVLGLIFGAVWLVRRLGPAGFLAGRGPGLPVEVIGLTHLGPKRSIYAVRTAGRLLLLGVTPAEINLLSEIREEEVAGLAPAAGPGRPGAPPAPAGPGPGAFGRQLARVLGGLDRSRARLTHEDVG